MKKTFLSIIAVIMVIAVAIIAIVADHNAELKHEAECEAERFAYMADAHDWDVWGMSGMAAELDSDGAHVKLWASKNHSDFYVDIVCNKVGHTYFRSTCRTELWGDATYSLERWERALAFYGKGPEDEVGDVYPKPEYQGDFPSPPTP